MFNTKKKKILSPKTTYSVSLLGNVGIFKKRCYGEENGLTCFVVL